MKDSNPDFSKRELPEIKNIQERIERLKEVLEQEESPETKKEIIKREIKAYLEEIQKIPSFAPPLESRDEVREISQFPPSQQVGALISLVFEKGLKKAISIARQLNNPAILDEFHDILVDRYYEQLLKKGVLKNL